MKTVFIAKAPCVLVEVFFDEDRVKEVTLKESARGFYCHFHEGFSEEVVEWLKNYSQKKPSPFPLPLMLDHFPEYSASVLKALGSIEFSQVIEYKELAKKTGNPRAARAVGNACGKNPYPLFLPCHRVVASDGQLGGFLFGKALKKLLLEFELK